MAKDTSSEVLQRYLQDAVAAEEHFENQLRRFADEATDTQVRQLFAEHADETKRQYERLLGRLEAIGGSRSGMKAFLAGMFGTSPRTAQMGHEKEEKVTQDLMMAYAVESSEIAMYEALATVASAAGDGETERLAREIQQEERRACERVWNLIGPMARQSFQQVTAGEARKAA